VLKVAYLGDCNLPGPASYPAGIMTHFNLPFIHVPSGQTPPDAVFAHEIGLYILSDYGAANWAGPAMEKLCSRVWKGAGLIMLGGWESYHGLGGDYDATPLAELLPVEISRADDRRNWPQLILVRKVSEHAMLQALPFDRPPGIGGYNQFTPKPEATVILEGERYRVACGNNSEPEFTADGRFPLLAVQQAQPGPEGAGRRACLATDVAPHWVGGFVDWGDRRLTVQLEEGFIEVGNWYAEFFRNLVRWGLGEDGA
jgi:uncharacterized membrane protein